MPQWDDVLDEAESDAIHAYLVDLSWRAYQAQETDAAAPGGESARAPSETGH